MIYDVIVIGAGVVGLSQAAALAQLGLRIAVVDQKTPPQIKHGAPEDLRVYAISRFTEQQLTAWQIWPLISSSRCCSYVDMNLCVESGSPNLCFHAVDSGEANLGYVLEENAWRVAALRALNEYGNCDFYWGCELAALDQRSDPIEIKITGEKNLSLMTQLLIAADGRQSRVRALANISLETFSANQTATIFHVETELPHQNTAWQFFTSQGIVAFLPLATPKHCSIVWSMPNVQFDRQQRSSNDWRVALQSLSQNHFGGVKLISAHLSFPLMQQQAQTYFSNKVVLIGDAAHGIHPLAGQGANLGIADVAALTQKMTLAIAQKRSLADVNFLTTYSRERRSAAWQMMLIMDQIASCVEKNSGFGAAMRVGAENLNRWRPIKNILTQFALYAFCK